MRRTSAFITFLALAALLPAAGILTGCATVDPRPGVEPQGSAPTDDGEVHDARVLEQYDAARDRALFEAARHYRRMGDLSAAFDRLEPLLARRPAHHEARLLLVDVLIERDDLDAAAAQVARLREALPRDPRPIRAEGLLHELAGRSDEARQAFVVAASLERAADDTVNDDSVNDDAVNDDAVNDAAADRAG